MPTQGERQNFLWRPNDNSATTRLRYDLEAEHWTRAFKSAELKYHGSSFASDLSVIGLVLGLAINLTVLFILLITEGIKLLIPLFTQKPVQSLDKEVYTNHDLEPVFDKSRAIQEIEYILATRTSSDIEKRDDMFKQAATLVVNKQQASLSFIMYELELDFERACKIIDDLSESGIISGQECGSQRRVFIDSEVLLDLFFEVENGYSK